MAKIYKCSVKVRIRGAVFFVNEIIVNLAFGL